MVAEEASGGESVGGCCGKCVGRLEGVRKGKKRRKGREENTCRHVPVRIVTYGYSDVETRGVFL